MKQLFRLARRDLLALLLTVLLVMPVFVYFASAVPQGATVVGSPSVDTGPARPPSSRTDPGGRIITLNLNLEQQNQGWKAYVGNITGSYVLQNANNASIYEWPLTSIQGELYISRGASVSFGSILCANTTHVNSENAFFGFNGADADSINRTFNATNHSAFSVGTVPILESNCSSTATWVNDTVQPQSTAAIFQEILLSDGTNLVYTSLINNDRSGFDNVSTFDFQAIVADNRSSVTGATYYFYLELGN